MSKSSTQDVEPEVEVNVSIFEKIRRFYRGTFFQAILLGLVSFTQPGIWVGLNSLGAGGMASPFFVNAANVITFAIMVFFSPISAIVGNRFNLKWVLVFGTLGYVPYSAALYCNSVFGTQWFLLFGSVTCGFSAAALWTSEAALAVGYPEASKRGLYIAIWLALNKLGQIIGSSIQLALNIDNDQQGSISPNTYLVLVALQCLGLPLSLMIAPADKLIRSDGTKPTYTSHKTSLKQGLKDFWAVCRKRQIYLMIPIFISAQWGQTYQGNYLTAYFSVRGRALAGFVISLLSAVVDVVFGYLLDSKIIPSRARRGKISWAMIVLVYTGTWAWNFVLEVEMSKTLPSLDYTSPGYGRAVGVYCLYRVGYESLNVWMYWILGTFDTEVDTLALTTALLRGGESLGSAFSYGVGASKSASLLTNLIVAATVFWASVPPTTWSIWSIRDDKDKIPPSPESGEAVETIEAGGLKD